MRHTLLLLLTAACDLPEVVDSSTTPDDEALLDDGATSDPDDAAPSCTAETSWFALHDAEGTRTGEGLIEASVLVTNLREDHMDYPGVVLTIDQPYAIDTDEWWWYGMFAGDTYEAPFTIDLSYFPEESLDEVHLTFEITTLNDEDIDGCALTCNVQELLDGACEDGVPVE